MSAESRLKPGTFQPADHSLLALEAERAERPGVEREQPPLRGPSSSQRAVSTRRKWPCEKTSTSPSTREQHSRPRGRHAPRAARRSRRPSAVAPDRPVGILLADLHRREAVELAVVPLGEVLAQLGLEARQPRRVGARQRARSTSANSRPRSASPTPAPAARPPPSAARRCDPVCSAPAPLGLAVPDEHHFHSRHPRPRCRRRAGGRSRRSASARPRDHARAGLPHGRPARRPAAARGAAYPPRHARRDARAPPRPAA